MSSAHAAPSVYSSADHPDRVAVTGVLAGPAFRTEVTAQGAIAVRVSEAAVATAFDELTPAVLLAAGVRHIHVDGQVVLSPELAAPTLAFVRFLRAASAAGAAVNWRGTVDPNLDIRLLRHLSPPLADRGDHRRSPADDWRRDYRIGLCYYRVGPGCVLVTDRRDDPCTRDIVLRSPRHLLALTDFLVPGAVPGTGDPLHEAFQDLMRARLILRLGESAVVLPHRLVCRPVPWNVF
jgi:hypothetical protein